MSFIQYWFNFFVFFWVNLFTLNLFFVMATLNSHLKFIKDFIEITEDQFYEINEKKKKRKPKKLIQNLEIIKHPYAHKLGMKFFKIFKNKQIAFFNFN